MWNSKDVVAVILALCLMLAISSGLSWVKSLFGVDPSITMPDSVVSAWENLLFAIVGALSGYISGKNSKDD